MIKLLGIPFDANSSFLGGCALAPAGIRFIHTQDASNASTENKKTLEIGVNLLDQGDIFFPSDDSAAAHKLIVDITQRHLSDGSKLISLGGDHSITYPIIEAYKRFYPELHILHFDAHADIYDNFQDNYYSHASPFARILENNLATSLTQVGIRTVTNHQREQIKKYRVQVVEMKEFTLDFIHDLSGPLYISFDLDVLDPALMPAVASPVSDGLPPETVMAGIESIAAASRVHALGITGFDPDRDEDNLGLGISMQVIEAAIRILAV